jgi:hypothetical protein
MLQFSIPSFIDGAHRGSGAELSVDPAQSKPVSILRAELPDNE